MYNNQKDKDIKNIKCMNKNIKECLSKKKSIQY